MANQDELAKGPSGNSFGYKWSTRMRGWILVSWFSQLAGYLPSRDSLAISGRDGYMSDSSIQNGDDAGDTQLFLQRLSHAFK